jgi:16S rRNA (guanine966-N2)-methyltransferase
MRIVGGDSKGRRLKVSKTGTRPTRSIVRETIFNIIGPRVNAARILDVFAGSGALGIEAISRGATDCIFVEKGDFRAGLRKLKERSFDLIFLDPPYHRNYLEKTLILIVSHNLLHEGGVIIAEHSPEDKFVLPDHFSVFKKKQYGNTIVTFIVQSDKNKKRE